MNVRKLILAQYRLQQGVPFRWGSADCLHFCAACAIPIVGTDPIAHLRGTYDSEIGARRVMLAHGWRDLGDVAASLFREIPVAQAQAGDWARCLNAAGEHAGTEGLGVVVGDQIAAQSETGVGFVPLLSANRAFRVAPR